MMPRYALEFQGPWPLSDLKAAPDWAGIYFVYAGTAHGDGTTTLNDLLYIGESQSIRKTAFPHQADWEAPLPPGHACFLTAAPYPKGKERRIIKAGCIHQYEPPYNQKYKKHFRYPKMHLSLTGMIPLLPCYFVVVRTRGNRGKEEGQWRF